MIWPATSPTTMTQNRSKGRSIMLIAIPVPIRTSTPAEMMPVRSVQRRRPIEAPSLVRTNSVPSMEENMPRAATIMGSKNK